MTRPALLLPLLALLLAPPGCTPPAGPPPDLLRADWDYDGQEEAVRERFAAEREAEDDEAPGGGPGAR